MGSLSSSSITIKPITSEADIPICAHLSDIALKPDGFHEFKARYSSKNVYDDTFEKLTDSLRDERGRFFLFKAVLPSTSVSDSNTTATGEADAETIVGFTHWRIGYVESPKVDPFAPRQEMKESSTFETGLTNMAVAEASGQEQAPGTLTNGGHVAADGVSRSEKPRPFYSNPHEELSRKLSNVYIGTIRGKRHLYLHRLIVHPSYQRQGIGQKLVDWGIETSERENLAAWLFCRPAGYKLYERNGWKVVLAVEVNVPDDDLKVAPVVAMLRLPVQQRR